MHEEREGERGGERERDRGKERQREREREREGEREGRERGGEGERDRERLRGRGGRERDSAYPYVDKLSSGGTEPVPVRTEDKSIDDLSSIPSIQMLPLIQIP